MKFKTKLKEEIEENRYNSSNMQEWLWKVLIMTEVAHRSFSLETKIEHSEKFYFIGQGAVGRFFGDWQMDWVSENYYEIANYIAAYYWPDNDRQGFSSSYKPFSTFKLD